MRIKRTLKYLHDRIYLGPKQYVAFNLDTAVNVVLLTDSDFRKFLDGKAHSSYGGKFKESPGMIYPDRPGYYNLVVYVSGGSAQIKFNYEIFDA